MTAQAGGGRPKTSTGDSAQFSHWAMPLFASSLLRYSSTAHFAEVSTFCSHWGMVWPATCKRQQQPHHTTLLPWSAAMMVFPSHIHTTGGHNSSAHKFSATSANRHGEGAAMQAAHLHTQNVDCSSVYCLCDCLVHVAFNGHGAEHCQPVTCSHTQGKELAAGTRQTA